VSGYEVLASSAKAQVPELSRILTNEELAGVRQSAAGALGSIGPDAKSAASALLITAKDKDALVRCSSVWALSRIDADAGLVLPGLIERLDDSFANTRQFAALALAKYGPLATSAIPALVRTMTTNREARRALLAIDPKAASGLEVK
jgi:HEAT repeat protein